MCLEYTNMFEVYQVGVDLRDDGSGFYRVYPQGECEKRRGRTVAERVGRYVKPMAMMKAGIS